MNDVRAIPVEIDPSVLWLALTEDSEARVGITTLDGEILYANAIAQRRHAHRFGGSLLGSAVRDQVSKELAHEFRRAKERALASGRPVTIETIIDGVQTHLTYRSFVSGGQTLFLVVARDAAQPLSNEHPCQVTSAQDLGPLAMLTRREREILALIGEHLTSQEIADRLERSVKTIEWHRVAIGRKLGVRTRGELAQIAQRAGLSRPHAEASNGTTA